MITIRSSAKKATGSHSNIKNAWCGLWDLRKGENGFGVAHYPSALQGSSRLEPKTALTVVLRLRTVQHTKENTLTTPVAALKYHTPSFFVDRLTFWMNSQQVYGGAGRRREKGLNYRDFSL